MTETWLYFGCGINSVGHYLFLQNGQRYHSYGNSKLKYLEGMNFDGILAPQPESNNNLYKASFSRLGGWGYCALSWWDRSKDTRGGSNSTILAPDLRIHPIKMLEESKERFPWVFERLPQELKLQHYFFEDGSFIL